MTAPDAPTPARPDGARPALVLRDLRKSFGDAVAVDGVDLEVGQGEFFALLGPSGSGKTTTLMLLAGFETPSAGTIRLDGRPIGIQLPNSLVLEIVDTSPVMKTAILLWYHSTQLLKQSLAIRGGKPNSCMMSPKRKSPQFNNCNDDILLSSLMKP